MRRDRFDWFWSWNDRSPMSRMLAAGVALWLSGFVANRVPIPGDSGVLVGFFVALLVSFPVYFGLPALVDPIFGAAFRLIDRIRS
jgi:hypothetical protein